MQLFQIYQVTVIVQVPNGCSDLFVIGGSDREVAVTCLTHNVGFIFLSALFSFGSLLELLEVVNPAFETTKSYL